MRCVVRNPEVHQGKRPSDEAQMGPVGMEAGVNDGACHALDAGNDQ